MLLSLNVRAKKSTDPEDSNRNIQLQLISTAGLSGYLQCMYKWNIYIVIVKWCLREKNPDNKTAKTPS